MKKTVYYIFTLLLILHLCCYWVKLEGIIAVLTSLYMPICFAFFFRRIDVFEQESWKDIVLVFVVSCITLLIYSPFIGFVHSTFDLPDEIGNASFLQMLFAVAIPEEIIKIIPVLIILKTTKFINEPIDYIIYSSISALGFAFIENIQYISSMLDQDMNIIAIRSFFPTLMHMSTTSIIGYQIYKYQKQSNSLKKSHFLYIILAFILAAVGHAMYNLLGIWILLILCGYYASNIKETLKDSPFINKTNINNELSTQSSVTNSGYNSFYIYMIFGVLLMDIIFGYINNGVLNLDILSSLVIIIILFSIIINSALDKSDVQQIWKKIAKK